MAYEIIIIIIIIIYYYFFFAIASANYQEYQTHKIKDKFWMQGESH